MREIRNPLVGSLDKGNRAFDLAERPQGDREEKHHSDSRIVSKPKGQIVISSGLEECERVPNNRALRRTLRRIGEWPRGRDAIAVNRRAASSSRAIPINSLSNLAMRSSSARHSVRKSSISSRMRRLKPLTSSSSGQAGVAWLATEA
jgi:hypothetical protein